MGNVLGAQNIQHLEHNVIVFNWFIALDASSKVLPCAPSNAPPGAGPYTLAKGAAVSIGYGTIVKQPWISTGLFEFTLDQPWGALIGAQVTLYDQGAAACPVASVRANVRSSTSTSSTTVNPRAGIDPGTETSLLVQTVYIRFRLAANGTIADLAASTGFWVQLMLKNTLDI